MLINTLFLSKPISETNHSGKTDGSSKTFGFLFSEIMNVKTDSETLNLIPDHIGGNLVDYKSVFINYNFDSSIAFTNSQNKTTKDPIVSLAELFLSENTSEIEKIKEPEKIVYTPQQFLSSFSSLLKAILNGEKGTDSIELKLFSKNFILSQNISEENLSSVEKFLNERIESEPNFLLSLSALDKKILFEVFSQIVPSMISSEVKTDNVDNDSVEITKPSLTETQNKQSQITTNQTDSKRSDIVSNLPLNDVKRSIDRNSNLTILKNSEDQESLNTNKLSNQVKQQNNSDSIQDIQISQLKNQVEGKISQKSIENFVTANNDSANTENNTLRVSGSNIVTEKPKTNSNTEILEQDSVEQLKNESNTKVSEQFNIRNEQRLNQSTEKSAIKIYIQGENKNISTEKTQFDTLRLNNISKVIEQSSEKGVVEISARINSQPTSNVQNLLESNSEQSLNNQFIIERQVQNIFRTISSNRPLNQSVQNNNIGINQSVQITTQENSDIKLNHQTPLIELTDKNLNVSHKVETNNFSASNISVQKQEANGNELNIKAFEKLSENLNLLEQKVINNLSKVNSSISFDENTIGSSSEKDSSKTTVTTFKDSQFSGKNVNNSFFIEESKSVNVSFDGLNRSLNIKNNDNSVSGNNLTNSSSNVIGYENSNLKELAKNPNIETQDKQVFGFSESNETSYKSDVGKNSNSEIRNSEIKINNGQSFENLKRSDIDNKVVPEVSSKGSNIISEVNYVDNNSVSNKKNSDNQISQLNSSSQKENPEKQSLSKSEVEVNQKVLNVKQNEKTATVDDNEISQTNLSNQKVNAEKPVKVKSEFEVNSKVFDEKQNEKTLSFDDNKVSQEAFQTKSKESSKEQKSAVSNTSNPIRVVNEKPAKGIVGLNSEIKAETEVTSSDISRDSQKGLNNSKYNKNNELNNSNKINSESVKLENNQSNSEINNSSGTKVSEKQFEPRLENFRDTIANKQSTDTKSTANYFSGNDDSQMNQNSSDYKNYSEKSDNQNISSDNQEFENQVLNAEKKVGQSTLRNNSEFSFNHSRNDFTKAFEPKSLENFVRYINNNNVNIRSELSNQMQNNNSVELRLYPEELGRVKITIENSDNTVSAQIEVQSEQAKNIILTNLPNLKEALNKEGLNVQNLNVQLSGEEKKSQNNSNQRKKNGNGRAAFDTEEQVEEGKMKNLGYNTIEYLA